MKNNQRINNLSYLKDRRKELRNRLTPAEAALWSILKNSGLDGRKFRRQHSICNYILDFYCPSEKLAIELDGEIHNNPLQAKSDKERDAQLLTMGIVVIRFENRIVFEHPEHVLQEIARHFKR